jgi:hypothetical protein
MDCVRKTTKKTTDKTVPTQPETKPNNMKKAIFIAVLGVAASMAYADPAVVTKPVNPYIGYYVNGDMSDATAGNRVWDKITMSGSYSLSGIDWSGEYVNYPQFFGSPSDGTPSGLSFTLGVYSNSGGTPGSLLGSVSLGSGSGVMTGNINGTSFGAATHQWNYNASFALGSLPDLMNGQTYWLSIQATANTGNGYWSWEYGTGADNVEYGSDFGALPGNAMAYTLYGQVAPVPEPSTLALAGLGGFGMLFALRRKKA